MWSLTTDIMVKQTIHQCILDQRIPPLTSVLCTAEQVCNVFSRHSLRIRETVMCVTMLLCAYEMHNLLTRGKHLFKMPGDVLLLNISYAD